MRIVRLGVALVAATLLVSACASTRTTARATKLPDGIYAVRPDRSLDASGGIPLVLTSDPIATTDREGHAALSIALAPLQASALRALTRAHLGQPVAVVVGGVTVAEPVVRTAIDGGHVELSGCGGDGCRSLVSQLRGHTQP